MNKPLPNAQAALAPAKKVVVALVQDDNRFLMVRRKAAEGDLRWHFPGGKAEPGETAMQTAQREVLEETGVSCTARRVMGERTHPDTGRVISYVLCAYQSGTAHVTEPEVLDQVTWMEPSQVFQAVTTDLFPPVRDVLETSDLRATHRSACTATPR